MPKATVTQPREQEPENEPARDTSKIGRFRNEQHRARPIWLILGAALLVALGVIGYRAWNYFSARETTDDAQIDGHIVPISPRVAGTVISVSVKDNEYVTAGTVLVELDPKDYQVAVQKAQADLAEAEASAEAARTRVPVASTTTSSQINSARANLEQAQGAEGAAAKAIDTARARVASARARLQEAEVNYTRALRDLERMKNLIAKDEISRQQYDAAFAASEAAKASRDSAEAAITETEREVEGAQARLTQARGGVSAARAGVEAAGTAPEQISILRSGASSAEARIKQIRAVLAQAELNAQYTIIKAPASGVISKKNVEIGQTVQPGQPLFALIPLDDIWVTANFKENQLKSMRPGQPAIMSVDAYGGRKYKGHVDSIAAATGARFSLLPPENATGNYVKVVQRVPVKIVFEQGQDPEHLLRPGMSVEPTVMIR